MAEVSVIIIFCGIAVIGDVENNRPEQMGARSRRQKYS